MKILLFIDSLGSGGAQRQLIALAKMLKNKSFDVEVLCYHKNDFFAQELIDNNIKINWIIHSNPIFRILSIRNFIRRGYYNVVISFLNVPDLLNCIAAIGGRTWKVITSERSANNLFMKSFKGKIFSFFRCYSDYIVCNSENSMNMWQKEYPYFKNKLKVIYNTIALPSLTSQYIPFENNKINIVLAASYQKLKNPVLLIESLNLLSKSERNRFSIKWYGSINTSLSEGTVEYDKAVKLISEYKLVDIIQLHNETPNVHNLLNKADIVALFSNYEGLPNVICEAMFLGKPVVMTKVSDYTRLIDRSNGFLCDDVNSESIAKTLRQILFLSNDEILEMGLKSLERATCLFNKNKISDQWLSLLT